MDILGLYRDNGKEYGNHRDYRDYMGIIEDGRTDTEEARASAKETGREGRSE